MSVPYLGPPILVLRTAGRVPPGIYIHDTLVTLYT